MATVATVVSMGAVGAVGTLCVEGSTVMASASSELIDANVQMFYLSKQGR